MKLPFRLSTRTALIGLIGTVLLVAAVRVALRGHAGGVNIWRAVEQDDLPAIEKYAKAGGDPDVINWVSGCTPLLQAVYGENLESYRRLLELGADPDVYCPNSYQSRVGDSVIYATATVKDSSWLRLALQYGANPNLRTPPRTSTPLIRAVSVLDPVLEDVKLLVEHGAELDAVDESGTALDRAMMGNKYESILYLLEQGADFQRISGYRGIDFLEVLKSRRVRSLAREEDRKGLLAIRQWMEDHGVPLDYEESHDPPREHRPARGVGSSEVEPDSHAGQ